MGPKAQPFPRFPKAWFWTFWYNWNSVIRSLYHTIDKRSFLKITSDMYLLQTDFSWLFWNLPQLIYWHCLGSITMLIAQAVLVSSGEAAELSSDSVCNKEAYISVEYALSLNFELYFKYISEFGHSFFILFSQLRYSAVIFDFLYNKTVFY